MKRLLIFTDLLFFICSCIVVYLYFFISPLKNNSPDNSVVIIFLTSLFTAIVTGTTLLLYSPHLIIRRMRQNSLTKKFVWKDVFRTSLRRGFFLGTAVTIILILGLFKEGSLLNYLFVLGILTATEVYFSQK